MLQDDVAGSAQIPGEIRWRFTAEELKRYDELSDLEPDCVVDSRDDPR
jgi:hypothetical protein